MFSNHPLWILGLTLLFEYLWGDPRSAFHPVALFGRYCRFIETKFWHNNKTAGLWAWLLAIFPPFALALLLTYGLNSANQWLTIFFQALLLWVSLGWRSLLEHVQAVADSETLEQAKQQVGYIVGRDTSNMHEQDVYRATIESLAENSSDSIIAPLFWFLIFGAPGAWLYRMINTLDAMWGYKHQRYYHFGWWAAKADDVANLFPARLTALFMLIQKPSCFCKAIYDQARQHNSPNAGFPETSMAFMLGIKLGGPVMRQDGIEKRIWMGSQTRTIEKTHIQQGMRITNRAVYMMIAFCLLVF